MEISFVVIHELSKEKGKVGASLKLSRSTINAKNEDVIQLILDLNDRYKYKNERYSRFDKVNTTIFYEDFAVYSKNESEKDFIQFSQRAAKDLKIRIENIAPAKGGYLIFAHYEHIKKYVGVFLVRNTSGLSFSDDLVDDSFDIKKVKHVDFENLAMACRVNLETYSTDETRYLSFINQKGDEMSQFFTRWISVSDSETNEEDTEQLYKIFIEIPTPIDKKTGQHIDRTIFLKNVHNYINSAQGKQVNIRSLSDHFYENEKYINDYTDERNIIISGEFKAHPKMLKRFIQISAKADNIELSFSHDAYKTKVRFNENDVNQIIIDSETLANKLRESIYNSN